MEWILASASPRRRQLLKEIIPYFKIIPAKGEEDTNGVDTPRALVQKLALQKAEEVARLSVAKGKAVIGADTVVALDREVLGKPKDEKDAARMLSLLSGKTHEVYTGVCILLPDGEKLVDVDCTKVTFHTLDEEQIRLYIASGSPMDKAGAYGIQDGGLVKEIDGSFSNVVGLPVELCRAMVERIKN